MKTSFMFETLDAIRDFNEGLRALGDDYEKVRAYVLRGEEISEELKQKADALQALRSEAIQHEMFYLNARLQALGVELPQDFLDGTALDPVVEHALYKIDGNFMIFTMLSWYEPEEAIGFIPRQIMKEV
ncbi:MAG: hypothetical protein E7323_03150 [Clostridiales bacterium]|nr:hypothetical protein [Clostridiales bacterium]